MEVRFKKLTTTAKMPTRAHATDAGMDLYVDEVKTVNVTHEPYYMGKGPVIDFLVEYESNIAVEIPVGYVGLLFPRSSVYQTGETLTNCVGVIDSGFRGGIKAVFRLFANSPHYKKGERFAQLIIMPYPEVEFVEAEELTTTDRGDGGYGSTGK